jgi:SSS family solute:Na+ symporter
MLLALITIMIVILNLDNMSVWNAISSVPSISNKDWIDLSPTSPTFFLKQIIGGMLIALTMTGLDQSMMQKSLSCKNETDATKNISWFGIVVFFVNFAFLIFGALLYSYANQMGISPPDGKTDLLFPELAMNHLGPIAALAFVLGLLAATFSSADSVLTTLTTSFCFDFLDFENKKNGLNAARTRKTVHFIMGGLLFLVMLLFDILNKEAIIQTILTVAGYTYGPLLGIFLFAIKFKRKIHLQYFIPIIVIVAPLFTFFSRELLIHFTGYSMGFELLGVNAAITVLGLYLSSFYIPK